MKTSERIINILKENGAMTAKILSSELGLTTMGVRQHMLQLEESKEVIFEDKKAVRGRPTRYWKLTDRTNRRFPDAHESLTLNLIDSVKEIFGEQGLEQLISHREMEMSDCYSEKLGPISTLAGKLEALAELRSTEGYMASIKQKDGFFLLIENHCSICAAANRCQNFCRSELQLFRALLAGFAYVSRTEHILQGARRCVYKIIPHS